MASATPSSMPDGLFSRACTSAFFTVTMPSSGEMMTRSVAVSLRTMPATCWPFFFVTSTLSKPGAMEALGMTMDSRK